MQSRHSDAHWKHLFADRFEVSEIQTEAAKLAGGWKRLYAARHSVDKEAQPWQKPSSYEVDAAGAGRRRSVLCAGPEACRHTFRANHPGCLGLPGRPAATCGFALVSLLASGAAFAAAKQPSL